MTNSNIIYPLAIIGLTSFFFFRSLFKNGEVNTTSNNPFVVIPLSILNVFLLWGAGFFQHCNWPQITWFVLFCGAFAVLFYDKKERKHSFFSNLVVIPILYFIYYKGGAFQYLG